MKDLSFYLGADPVKGYLVTFVGIVKDSLQIRQIVISMTYFLNNVMRS